MGGTAPRKSFKLKARPSTGKQNVAIKQAAKKRHQKWSKDRSECVRDALNRDTDLLYNSLKNTSEPSMIPQTDADALLAESMHGLGR